MAIEANAALRFSMTRSDNPREGEISTTSDMQMIPLEWQKVKRN